jgi:hypothetical protein
LALLVGRLESKYIDPPVWLITALYSYAVIQGALGAFGVGEADGSSMGLQAVMLYCGFALKCLLFLFVAWVMESGLLLSYMRSVREVNRQQAEAANAA